MSFIKSSPSEDSSLEETKAQTVISEHKYIPVVKYMSHTNNEPIVKGRFVRLMSIESLERSESSNSSENADEATHMCPQYWDTISFAENFVDDIIAEAEGLVNKHVKELPKQISSSEKVFARRYSGEYPLIEYNRPKFTGWPTIREFTIELGADKIDEYLASFSTNEEWLYIIYYLGLETDSTSSYYKYQATWSLPSLEYPIAQATASVFFTIEVSEAVPADCLVNVTFTFEGHQFVHKPGLTDFCEEWLNYILDCKIGVFRNIKF